MLKSFLIGILLWGTVCPLAAQKTKTDSLLGVVRTQSDDTNKVNTLNLLSRQLYLTGKYDSGMVVARDAIALGTKIAYKKGVANGFNNVGNVFFSTGEYDSSLANHKRSLKIQLEIGNKVGIASSNNNMGNIYFMEGNYPAALESYLVARSMYDVLSQNDPMVRANLAAASNNIGNVNLLMKNYDSALVNYNKSLAVRLIIGDKHGAAACYGNIGSTYYRLGDYDAALKNHQASLQLKREIDDQQGIAASYGNIGALYYDLAKYDLALENLLISARMSDSLDFPETLANAYTNIGQTYVKQGRNEEAIEVLNKALAIGKKIEAAEVLKNSYDGLYRADSALGRWEEAYSNLQQFIFYRDQLLNDEKTREVVTAQMNYQFEKEKAEKEVKQQAELERERLVKWGVVGVVFAVLVISLLVFNRYRLKQKNEFQVKFTAQQKEQANAVMETQESERKRIAEDLHDSLGHLLSTAKMHLQTFPAEQKIHVENSLHLLNQASEEIRNITFNLMPHTLEEGGLIPALHELAGKVTKAGVVKVNLHVHNMEKFTLEKQSQFNIYRIVQEAVNNILKHADAKHIDIQLNGLNDHISIMIEDDGKGFDTTTKKAGRGLKNIVTRSLWLKGNINIDSSPGRGTTITTEIPV
jgi:two-component system, NarL family, sensor kinase